MQTITLQPLLHRGAEIIAVNCKNIAAINNVLKKVEGIQWSQTNRCWYIPQNEAAYHVLVKSLKEVLKQELSINTAALKEYLQKKKAYQKPTAPAAGEAPAKRALNAKQVQIIAAVSAGNLQQLELFTQRIMLKAYSGNTLDTYRSEFLQLLQTIKNRPVETLTVEELKRYMAFIMKDNGVSENTANSRLNALKFYFEQVLGREEFFWDIPRAKKPDQLPKVLGENEIGRLFNAVKNIKHKAILFTAYSAGLRVSEVINLKIAHVDSDRMQLFVEKSKGKKDRYVGLSILLLDVLRAYLKATHPMPKVYVFENPYTAGKRYSVRSAQTIFKKAKEKAMVNKHVSFHSLRHSFATHLLEKGIDIHYIKELLGHFDIKTTERYLHVKRETLVNIPNVLDELNKSVSLDW